LQTATPGVPIASPGRASLLVLGMAAFMVQADARVIDPLLHVVARDFHTLPPGAAIVISSYALPYGLFQLFYGPLGDRIGKLKVMATCLTLFAFGTFACAFVPSLRVFAVLRFLTGVVAAAIIPMSLGYMGDKFPYETRQIALGRFMSALMMGQIMGSTLGGIFGQYLGWRNIFLVFGVTALGVSVLLAREGRRFPELRKTDRKFGAPILAVPLGGSVIFAGMLGVFSSGFSRGLEGLGACLLIYALVMQYGSMLRLPGAPVVLGTVLLEGLFVFGGLSYLASSLTDRFAVNYASAGLMLTGFGIGGLAYSFSVKKLVNRIGELGILLLGGTLLGVAFVSIGLMQTWQWFIPLVVLLGMGYYTMHGTLQTRATELAPEARGTAVSLFAFFFFMGQATGPQLLGGILTAYGYGPAFVTAGAGLFLVSIVSRQVFALSKRRALALATLAVFIVTGVPTRLTAQAPPSDVTVVPASGGLGLTVFSATYLRSPTATYVLVGVEIQGLAATTTATGAEGPRQLELRIRDGDSPTAPEHPVDVSLADSGTVTRASVNVLRILARVSLAPGHHALQIVAHDTGNDSTATVVHAIEVPSLVDSPMTMSNLVLTSSTAGGVTHAEVEEDASLPILGRPPTGRRQFRRGERVEVNAEIYDAVSNTVPDDGFDSLSVATSIFAANGLLVYEISDAGASEPLEIGVYGYKHYALVPTKDLVPGPYVVRVAALLNGVVLASRSVPITVLPSN
jgi:predicted MFS family arabinose efflux permease